MSPQEQVNKLNLISRFNEEKLSYLNRIINNSTGEDISLLYVGRLTLLAFLIKEQSEAKNEGLGLNTIINRILSKHGLNLNKVVLNDKGESCSNGFQIAIDTGQLEIAKNLIKTPNFKPNFAVHLSHIEPKEFLTALEYASSAGVADDLMTELRAKGANFTRKVFDLAPKKEVDPSEIYDELAFMKGKLEYKEFYERGLLGKNEKICGLEGRASENEES